MKIGINGFGRIGRCVLRAALEKNYDIKNIVVNSTMKIEDSLHNLKYDSVFGRFNAEFKIINDNQISINEKVINFISERDINNIKWENIDIVFECTGVYTSKEKASLHLKSGAKKVLISAPAKEKDVPTIVFGVNDEKLTNEMDVLSVGSCTTNCLAPIAKILDENFKIKSGFMTTIHSYTGDQNILDGSHKDLRRGRAAGLSMVPTSTGAAKALSLVLPNLEGKLDGAAIRVPTPNVSVVDLVVNLEKNISIEEVNSSFIKASESYMKKILSTSKEELVSIDYVKSEFSSNVDLLETKVVGGNCARILSWYDNEWAFSLRMLDIAEMLSKFI